MLNEIPSSINIIPFSEISFCIERIDEEYWISYHAYFRDREGHLLWFFKFHIPDIPPFVATINDSTNSSSYDFFSVQMKRIYIENNFNREFISEKWSAHQMLQKVLEYIHSNFIYITWVDFSENQWLENKKRLKKLINQTEEKSSMILDMRWWRECSWTIQIRV